MTREQAEAYVNATSHSTPGSEAWQVAVEHAMSQPLVPEAVEGDWYAIRFQLAAGFDHEDALDVLSAVARREAVGLWSFGDTDAPLGDRGSASSDAKRSGSTYEEVVAEVAADLQLNEQTLRESFSAWLHSPGCVHSSLPPEYNHACYAVYRLTKLRDALQMVSRSRSQWRERAMELGSPGHLRQATS